MSTEKSAGIVIFRKEGDKVFYLLLHYPKGSRTIKPYWDFPKGHIEKKETPRQAAIRETAEETGQMEVKLIKGFKEKIKYCFKDKKETVLKSVTFYLAESKEKTVRISYEHSGHKWLVFKDAFDKLTFKNAKDILKKANSFLKMRNV